MDHYIVTVKSCSLPQSMKDMLLAREYTTMDELGEAFSELIYMLEHADYYDRLDRYDRGMEILEKEESPTKQAKYRARLNELTIEIERLTPKEETA